MKIVIAALLAIALSSASAFAAESCGSAAFNLLKHLEGEWLVTRDDQTLGQMRVHSAAGGCALIEEWTAADGTRASAMHWPEAGTDEGKNTFVVLHQVYVDDAGWILHADGKIEDDVLIYEGKTTLEGENVTLRATLHGLGGDEVVHIGDISRDEGATWHRISTLRYRRQP